jgi:hypothetical protein
MPTYRYPTAPAPARIHVGRADKREVADDGTFEAPAGVARAIAERHDTTLAEMRVDGDPDTETCDTVKADGEVCGRELPCPYHSD